MTVPHMPHPRATTRGVGLIMARLDAPHAGREVRLRAAAVAIVLAVIAVAIVLSQRDITDSAFRAYALTAVDVDVSALLARPEQYRGRPVHVHGVAGVVLPSDVESQFILADPAASNAALAPPSGRSSAAWPAGILVLATSSTSPGSVVDVWGTLMGTTLEPSVAEGVPVPVLRAEYVRPGQ